MTAVELETVQMSGNFYQGIIRQDELGLFPCPHIQFMQAREPFGNLALPSVRSRLVELHLGHIVRKIAFSSCISFLFVVDISVVAPETQLFHEPGWCIAQMFGYRPGFVA